MSAITSNLQTEIARRETAFVARLMKNGLDELVNEYQAIVTLRQAAEVLSKPAQRNRYSWRVRNELQQSNAAHHAPEGFILSEEVRTAVRGIQKQRFRAADVFAILSDKFPDYIREDKRPSISATLSNLANNRELSKETDGQRKVWYRIVALREERPPEPLFFGAEEEALNEEGSEDAT